MYAKRCPFSFLGTEIPRRSTTSSIQCSATPISENNETKQYHNEEGSKEEFHAWLPAQVPASSVAKTCRWQRKTGARRRSARPKKTGKIEKKVAKATVGTGKGNKHSAVHHTLWKLKAMVPKKARVHCSIVRLAKRREGLGVQSLGDLSNLLLTGCLTEPNAFTTNLKVGPCSGTQTRVGSPELRRNNGKCEHVYVWQWCQSR